jgi:hypothetical protein
MNQDFLAEITAELPTIHPEHEPKMSGLPDSAN